MKVEMMKLSVIGFFVSSLLQAATILGPHATLSFEPGKTTLSNESENQLKELITQARQKAEINEVQIAVWSDNPVAREGEDLSRSDRDLAEKRSEAIEKYLKRFKVYDIDSHNMAERTSWLARMFNTDDAKLKSEMGRATEATMSKEEFQIFKNNGEPSKAVVLVILGRR